jgi:hypothetical protein
MQRNRAAIGQMDKTKVKNVYMEAIEKGKD